MSAYRPSQVPYLTRELADNASQEEVAIALGISLSAVSQLERRGLARLRRCHEMIEAGTHIDEAIEACKGHRGRPRTRGDS